jgi:hypothetical protein
VDASKNTPLVGRDVPDQTRLRATAPVRNLDEFLAFLEDLRVVTPPGEAPPRPPTTGDHFLL